MRAFLHRIHEWATRSPVDRYEDPVLGEFIVCDMGWEITVEGPDGPITLAVGGRYEPDEALLGRLRAIAGDLEGFTKRVKAFVEDQGRYVAETLSEDDARAYQGELRALKIESITCVWPKSPTLIMIYFSGPDECKCWRCDQIGEEFSNLVFDR